MYPCEETKIKQYTFSMKELCEMRQEAILEFRFTCFFRGLPLCFRGLKKCRTSMKEFQKNIVIKKSKKKNSARKLTYVTNSLDSFFMNFQILFIVFFYSMFIFYFFKFYTYTFEKAYLYTSEFAY